MTLGATGPLHAPDLPFPRDRARRAWLAAWPLFLLGCATPVIPPGPQGLRTWQGRMALRVDSEPIQDFSAGFTLRGDALRGGLELLGPLGQILARIGWDAQEVTLVAEGKTQRFDSLDALTRQLTGGELPIAALFDWLDGHQPAAPGWRVEMADLGAGRLRVRRETPHPTMLLRVIIERDEAAIDNSSR